MGSADKEAASNNEVELKGLSHDTSCLCITLEAFGHPADAACRLLLNTGLSNVLRGCSVMTC